MLAVASAARKNDGSETDLYWSAQRAELSGQSESALKSYDRLLGKFPQSGVAVDRLFDTAVLQGNLPAALKAARAQQLAESGDPALPLIFYVDAWKRKDWQAAAKASADLQQGVFGFMAPLLNAWSEVGQAREGGLSNGTLRENGSLAYYSDDQLIYFDLANGRVDSAKRRLLQFAGYGEDYGRHLALNAVEYLGANGQGDFANALLEHLGLEPMAYVGKAGKFAPEQALSCLFSRLSAQLSEQKAIEQAFYFGRLAQWIAPDSAYALTTLAGQLNNRGMKTEALAMLDGVADTRPQWFWVLGDKARLLDAQGQPDEALKLIKIARTKKPETNDLKLLEAQQLASKGESAGAEAIYRALISQADAVKAQNGRRVTLRMLLAQTLEARGNWPGSKAVLEEALAINDQNPQLLNSLGYGLLERREDIKRGLELVSEAHRLSPESPAIVDSLAWGHYLNGNFARAIPLLESAVQNALDDVAINEHLGDAYWRVGRLIDARYAWRAASLRAMGEDNRRISAKIDLGWTEANAAP